MSLSKSTFINVVWSFFEQLLRKGSAVITTLILALLLTPDDFGLVAMLTLFMAMGYAFIDGGLRSAVIRDPGMSAETISSAFYFNILIGFLASIFLYIAAPYIAQFYQQQRLTGFIQLASLSLVFQAFSVIPNAVMQRNMQYRFQFKTTLPAAITSSLVAICLAYLGYGAWSIIWQMVTFSFINSLLYWWIGHWRPSKFVGFYLLKPIAKFSGFVMLENIVKELYGKVYLAAVGKFFALGVVGLYFFAKKIAEMLVQQLVSAIQQVTFPALANVQHDEFKLKESYRKVIQLTTFLIFPIFLWVAASAHNLFELFLPEKWSDSANLLQYMMIISIFLPLHNLSSNIFLVKEKAKENFNFSILMMLLTFLSLYFTIELSIDWVLIGELFVIVSSYIIKMIYLSRLIRYSIIEQISDILPIMLLSLLLSVLLYYTMSSVGMNLFLELCLFGFLYLSAYLVLGWLLKVKGFNLAKQLVLAKNKSLS